jgi:predicted small secreted protein
MKALLLVALAMLLSACDEYTMAGRGRPEPVIIIVE